MIRDMRHVRHLLETIEAHPTSMSLSDVMKRGYTDDHLVVVHHVWLLADAQLVVGTELAGLPDWEDLKLTWLGHDYLDAMREREP